MHDLLRESGGVGIRLALARTLLNKPKKPKVLLIRVQDEQEKKVLQLLLQKLIQMDYLKVIITSNSQLTIECEQTIRVEQSMNMGSEDGCSNTKRGLDSGPDVTEKM
jgi:predicted ABC-type transport system involved in lysophospholipase L1 biosynthesis ATPase subunit